MILVMTLMVRDEADVISAMIDHHLAQGVDTIIVTDNGSVDGTLEILQGYVAGGQVRLHQDPVHRKQQHSTVTGMAREAHTTFGADWVLNADADEFWVAANPELTLREALEHTPVAIQSFQVPVIDLTGPPALSGSGFSRLVYRDNRPVEEMQALGLRAHSTPNAVHIGSADIVVSQGNHTVSLENLSNPEPDFAIEVLHLPWRSWAQFRHKVENAGRAYDANPDLTPSPKHHGMKDYRRLLDGALLPFYIARHPSASEIELGVRNGTLISTDRLLPLQTLAVPDVLMEPEFEVCHRAYGSVLATLEARQDESSAALRLAEDKLTKSKDELTEARRQWENTVFEHAAEVSELHALLAQFKSRRVVRLADQTGQLARRAADLTNKLLKK